MRKLYDKDKLQAELACYKWHKQGVAIASNQVESGNYRWFAMWGDDGVFKFYHQPMLIKCTGSEFSNKEACLSLPNEVHEVKRKEFCRIAHIKKDQTIAYKTFEGQAAIIVQHEMDHLEGRLINGEQREDHLIP